MIHFNIGSGKNGFDFHLPLIPERKTFLINLQTIKLPTIRQGFGSMSRRFRDGQVR